MSYTDERIAKSQNEKSCLVIITGYYGFDNLGDEAILEELLHEVAAVEQVKQIVVLSHQPEKTAKLYGVQSINRWQWQKYFSLFNKNTILISGGGGLFQDRTGIKSVIFYAGQILLAKFRGAKVVIYAQGLGPLKRQFSQYLTRKAFAQADSITVRDKNSLDMLSNWGLKANLAADPVWKLKPSKLPESVEKSLAQWKNGKEKLIGLSLRNDSALTESHLQVLAQSIATTFPHASVLLLPLQEQLDVPVLEKASQYLNDLGIKNYVLDTAYLQKPSHWLALFNKLDMVIAMRLHALIMALKMAKPVIGIAYDAKVSIILKQFGQPMLALRDESEKGSLNSWPEIIKNAHSVAFDEDAQKALISCEDMAQVNASQLNKVLSSKASERQLV